MPSCIAFGSYFWSAKAFLGSSFGSLLRPLDGGPTPPTLVFKGCARQRRLFCRPHGGSGSFWLDFRPSQGCFSVCCGSSAVANSENILALVCVLRSLIAWASPRFAPIQSHHLAYEFRVLSLVRCFGYCPSSVRHVRCAQHCTLHHAVQDWQTGYRCSSFSYW